VGLEYFILNALSFSVVLVNTVHLCVCACVGYYTEREEGIKTST